MRHAALETTVAWQQERRIGRSRQLIELSFHAEQLIGLDCPLGTS